MKLFQHLEKVEAFLAVARYGSLSRGAEKLHISQPALSKKIQILEGEMGEFLFIRRRQGMELTAQGQLLLKLGRDIEDLIQKLTDDLTNAEFYRGGSLIIGTYESIAIYFWPDFLVRFARKYPTITLTVHTGRSSELVKQLATGELDACVTVNPSNGRAYKSTKLFTDRFGIYGSTGAASDKTEVAVLFEDGLGANLALAMREIKIAVPKIRQIMKTDSFEVVRAMLRSGVGIGVLPVRVAANDVRAGFLRELPAAKLWQDSEHIVSISYQRKHAGNKLVKILETELLQSM